MFETIQSFLFSYLIFERAQLIVDSLRLIYNSNFITPIEKAHEQVMVAETVGVDETLLNILEIVNDTLTEILYNYSVITKGGFEFKAKILSDLNLLEHFIDSDVITTLHDEDLSAKEMLLAYIQLVSNKPIEYYDENIVSVSDRLVDRLYKKHLNKLDERIENNEEEQGHLDYQRAFASMYPTSLGVLLIKDGKAKLNLPINNLVTLYKRFIYKLDSNEDIAINIYSLVVISNAEPNNYNTICMQVVNELYNDLEQVSSLKYIVTNIKVKPLELNNVNS